MPLHEKELLARDAKRNIGEELLQATRDVNGGHHGAKYEVQAGDIATLIERHGFAGVSRVVTDEELTLLRESLAPLAEAAAAAGIRNLVAKAPCVRTLAQSSSIRALVEPILGREFRLVRSILFSKDERTNWQVPWHQDLAIAVQSRSEVAGFVSWSMKEGVPHVQPPAAILERMLAVRLHLDAADESNGALWISPGSHRLGRLPADEAVAVAERNGKSLCAVEAGGALLFRPLLLHASRKAVSSRPRRVIHLEFASGALPEPLAWAEQAV